MSRSKLPAAADRVDHAYVGFGSNVGYGPANFAAARRALEAAGYPILRQSTLYQAEPWGGAEGGVFTNAVLEIERRDTPQHLLQQLFAIENSMDRMREPGRFLPRRCDLDLLLWDSAVIDEPGLQVPHPRLAERNFVLIPLCDLIPDARHPLLDRTLAELLAASPDTLPVWPYQPSHLPPRA